MKLFQKKLDDEFNERLSFLNESMILDLNEKRTIGELNSVVTGLKKKILGIGVISEKPLKYGLMYIVEKIELEGYSLTLDDNGKDNDVLVFMFVKFLNQEFGNIAIIDLFNTFQDKRTAVYEMYQYITKSLYFHEYEKLEGLKFEYFNPNDSKQIKFMAFIDKVNFSRDFFICDEYGSNENAEKCVYLMIDTGNNLTKIGESKMPIVREKTLAGQLPQTHILVIWKAPVSVEKQLHRVFSEKRTRGEWFSLTFTDYQEIDSLMESYPKIEIDTDTT